MVEKSIRYIFYFFAFAIIFFSSCKSTQPATTSPSKTPDKPTTTVPAKEKEVEKPKDIPVKFNIALVMPFDLKSNFATTEEGSPDPEIKQNSLPALGFYEGATIAVDSLNASGR